jgi:2',3'-cyclic-nucleotide 2'-phosphodiesterase (5'-nucleotidase family)
MFAGTAGAANNAAPVEIRILTVSDWHGQLDPLFVFGEGTFGGAAELAVYFDAERADNPNSLTLTAGDAVGASPPLSNFFDEEPAVRSMRMMGFDADGFGNHNFDGGIADLQNLVDIANTPAGGAELGEPFQYVAANLENRDDNLSGVKDYEIFDVGGVKVAVIGIVNPEAPTLVFPGSFGTIEITDPAKAVKDAQKAAKKDGAQMFIVLTHMGVTGLDSSGDPVGPLIDLAESVKKIDLIIGDHTNFEFSGEINGALVVENRSKGRTYARIDMTVEPKEKKVKVIDSLVTFVEPDSSAVTPDPEIVAFLDPLRTELSGLLSGVIGQSTPFIPRADECGQGSGRLCESLVGDVVTDAMRTTYETDFAITNSGGLRADLTCPTIDNPTDFCPAPDGGDHEISDGQVLTVLPFGNSVVTLSLDGAELKTMLENGVSAMPGASGRFAQVSGLCFTYDIEAAVGSRVSGAVFQNPDGTCTGPAVDLTAASTYTLAENDFMAAGGDGYPDFTDRAVTRAVMDQDVAAYVMANTVITPSIQGRITCTTSGATLCPVPLP